MTALNGSCRRTDYITGDHYVDNSVGESRDQAAPLPDDGRAAGGAGMCTERAPADDVSGAGVTMRLYAKDKRNLRVKRRSTGIVSSYRPNSDTSNRQDSSVNSDDDGADDDTRRNTWHNETLVTVTSVTSVGCSTLTDLRSSASTTTSETTVVSADSQSRTLTDSAATMTDRSAACPGTSSALISHPSVVGRSSDAAHAGSEHRKTAPTVPPKPTVRARHTDTGCSPRPPNEQAPITGGTKECKDTLARVHALEKLVQEVDVENSLLKDRIVELETEVVALNKDLDLADEDYEKLEEENRALVRVVAQLSPR